MSEKPILSDYPNAQVKKQPFLSLVWLIPLIALLIGIGLTVKVYREKGPSIVIDFENARGIEAGRTHIRYKDVDIGKVIDVRLVRRAKATEMGENIIQDRALVTAELKSFMEDYLGEETVFWVVRPRISMGEVSGLSTLFSGFYIEMDPGNQRNGWRETYPGLDKPPKVTSYDRGTVISLNAKALGSLRVGSPVYYRQLKVGEVIGSELNSGTESVDISIYIKDKYADNVKSNTRFWNVSGIDVEVTPSGVSAKMESLTAFLIGGIAFETPKHESNSVDLSGDTTFHLYKSYKTAKEDTARDQKLYYVMYFDDTLFGLVKDSTLEYQGVQIGKVESIILKTDNAKGKIKTVVKVSIFVDKLSNKAHKIQAENLLKKLVIKGLHAQLKTSSLLTGSQYIALVYPDKKMPKTVRKERSLQTTMANHIAVFPTTYAATSILNFDASSLTTELTKTIKEVRKVVSSKDIKKIVTETSKFAKNLNKITKSLNDKGISGELVRTLQTTQQAIIEIQKVAKSSQSMIKQIEKTAITTQNSVQQSLGEDSALHYKLQVMLDELSETANSFSVLADTLQRKPNSVLFGK